MVDTIAGSDDGSEVTLDCLAALLECSLVRRQQDLRLGVRFLMPQALRAYACERLTASGLEDDVRYRHAEHVAGLAHAARLWKWGATAEQRSGLLAVSHEIRPALAWARAVRPGASRAPVRGLVVLLDIPRRHLRGSATSYDARLTAAPDRPPNALGA